jgi:hypothetical protein
MMATIDYTNDGAVVVVFADERVEFVRSGFGFRPDSVKHAFTGPHPDGNIGYMTAVNTAQSRLKLLIAALPEIGVSQKSARPDKRHMRSRR